MAEVGRSSKRGKREVGSSIASCPRDKKTKKKKKKHTKGKYVAAEFLKEQTRLRLDCNTIKLQEVEKEQGPVRGG